MCNCLIIGYELVCDINSVNNPGLTDNISHVLLYFWMIYHYIMC